MTISVHRREALARARAAAAESRRREAVEAYKRLLPLVRKLRRRGLSYERIARHLNERGCRTRQGRPFAAMTVWCILDRAPAPGRRR